MVQELKKLANIAESERNLFVRYFEALGKHQHNLLESDDDESLAVSDEIRQISRIALSLKDYKLDAVEQLLASGESLKLDNQITLLLDSIRDTEINDFENMNNTISETIGRIDKCKSHNESLINQSLNMLENMNFNNPERFQEYESDNNTTDLEINDREESPC